MTPTRRWTMSITMALAALAAGTPAGFAQTAAPAPGPAPMPADITSDIELTRAAIQLRRQALVTAALDLEPAESAAFWPLYRDYRTAMAKVNDGFVKLLVSYLDSYDTLSDEQATRMLDEYLDIERARTGVKATFVPRFRQVLPARKAARFFQVDHKLDALINADLAAEVPLVR